MSLKVYLAGGFFRDSSDWRCRVVAGLNERIVIDKESDWEVSNESIFDCFDYTGPYTFTGPYADIPEIHTEAVKTKEAIKNSDLVFAWIDNLSPSDVGRVSCELAYANALSKPTTIGVTDPGSVSILNTWFAHCFSSSLDVLFIDSDPGKALRSGLDYLVATSLPLDKQIEFFRTNDQSRAFCSDRLAKCGYIYLIKAETGHYKIGRSSNLPNRMKLFAVKLPFDFEIIHTFPAEDAARAERLLHNDLQDRRVQGEWFDLNMPDVALIKSITSFHAGFFYDRDGNWVGFETIDNSIEIPL